MANESSRFLCNEIVIDAYQLMQALSDKTSWAESTSCAPPEVLRQADRNEVILVQDEELEWLITGNRGNRNGSI